MQLTIPALSPIKHTHNAPQGCSMHAKDPQEEVICAFSSTGKVAVGVRMCEQQPTQEPSAIRWCAWSTAAYIGMSVYQGHWLSCCMLAKGRVRGSAVCALLHVCHISVTACPAAYVSLHCIVRTGSLAAHKIWWPQDSDTHAACCQVDHINHKMPPSLGCLHFC
jgi:hypothetical protein